MDARFLIAYALIASLALIVVGFALYLRHNTREQKIGRQRERDRVARRD